MLSQRRALGVLFLVLTLGFGVIALAAGREGVWVVAFADPSNRSHVPDAASHVQLGCAYADSL